MPYKDPAKIKAYAKEYRDANKEKMKDYMKDYREANKEDLTAYGIAYRKANRDKINTLQRQFIDRKIEWLTSHYGAGKLHCSRCGYDKSFVALIGHHLKPEQKKHPKDGMKLWMRTMSLKRFQDKILATDLFLLCSNCHIELHSGAWEYA